MDEIIYNVLEALPSLFLFLIIGISLKTLGSGADLVVDQAVKISIKQGISKVIVGATIVSLGTTIPEMTVSVAASLKGNPDLALGNAVGSIITNISLIVGLIAFLGEVKVEDKLINRQGRIQLISVIMLVIISLPIFSRQFISKGSSLLLVLTLLAYMFLTIYWSRREEVDFDDSYEEINESLSLQLIKMFFGIIIVIISSKVLIPSVEIAALRLGIPQGVVAATLVAFGTSLPELITSMTAVRKGYGDLAIGNIVGANILNVLFVVGVSGLVSQNGLKVPSMFYKLQYPTMLLAILSFHFFAKNKGKKISKKEGAFLLILYFIYLFLNYLYI